MRILIIGGTGFIGARVLRRLLGDGHELMVFHRGHCGRPEKSSTAKHVFGDRRELPSFAAEFRKFSPQVTLDVIPYSEQDAVTLRQTLRGITGRIVALSSQDVYRAYGIFTRLEEGLPDPVPYDEDAPLRTRLYPYRAIAREPDDLLYHYEKILVERAVSDPDSPGTILRLPQVYGPGDQQHRLFEYLKRMDDGRRVILLGEEQSQWRWTRGYVENVAAAIALAVTDERSAGRIYNLGEPEALSEMEWVRAVGDAAGWDGEIVVLPDEKLPGHLAAPGYDWRQSLFALTNRISTELGFEDKISREEALRRTIEWERANPPAEIDAKRFDYEAEDLVLARHLE